MDKDTAETIALQALAALLMHDDRRDRFLQLTGLTGDTIAGAINDEGFAHALLSFFMQHEPDLMWVASEIGAQPADIENAWRASSPADSTQDW